MLRKTSKEPKKSKSISPDSEEKGPEQQLQPTIETVLPAGQSGNEENRDVHDDVASSLPPPLPPLPPASPQLEPFPQPLPKKQTGINDFIKAICFESIFRKQESDYLFTRVSGNSSNGDSGGFNTIINHSAAVTENKMKKYLADNPNKIDYIRYCPKIRTPSVLDDDELAELKTKDPAYNDANRVLTDGEYNFVCDSVRARAEGLLYPRFGINRFPCCNIKDKNTENTTKHNTHVTKFSSKQILEEQWSVLPAELDSILNENNSCGETINSKKKKNSECFLIHGVENSETQSFISCLSSATATQTESKRRSIEMKTAIINSLTLDNFITFQNGNLVTDFQDTRDLIEKCQEIMNIKNINDEFSNTVLYQKLDMSNKENEAYFKKVLSAYVNFIDYLSDDEVVIDCSYLWDIVCQPNASIFKNGINLVIINVSMDGNLSVVCPSNHYSGVVYDENKETLFLVRKEATDTYEPIYFRENKFTKDVNSTTIYKLFREQTVTPSIRNLFDIVKPLLENCRQTVPNKKIKYPFKTPILLTELLSLLGRDRNLKQIVNYNNKVIGVTVNGKGFVPCYPSSIVSGIDYDFVKDDDIWEDYKKTKANLAGADKKIPCAPLNKIIDDEGYVVGILTEANQFVQLRNREKNDTSDDSEIPPLDNYNYVLTNDAHDDATERLLMSNKLDRNRMDETRRFKLENEFYNAFRNTIKIALNDFDDANLIQIRQDISSQIDSKVEIYINQVLNITRLLKQLIGNKVIFTGDEDFYSQIDDVSTCINKVKDADDCGKTETCSTDGNCSLIVPRLNLINKKRKNEDLYFKKMADEFIRYHYIRKQMFNPRKFIFFSNIDYNLRSNEIILLGSEMSNYYEGLVPAPENNFVTYNSYDEVNPVLKGGKKKTRRPTKKNNNKKKTRRRN
jgi:hypothetical protein